MGYGEIKVIDSVPNHSSSATHIMNELEVGGFTHNINYPQDMVVGIIYMQRRPQIFLWKGYVVPCNFLHRKGLVTLFKWSLFYCTETIFWRTWYGSCILRLLLKKKIFGIDLVWFHAPTFRCKYCGSVANRSWVMKILNSGFSLFSTSKIFKIPIWMSCIPECSLLYRDMSYRHPLVCSKLFVEGSINSRILLYLARWAFFLPKIVAILDFEPFDDK